MRTIKFRGKSCNTGEWFYGNLYIADSFGSTYIHKSMDSFLEVYSETIGQFTSLYDCNGKEIYEGDILDFNGVTVEVRFVRGVFVFLVNGNLDERLCGRTDLFAKIIGNIHENPDILKENERLNKISNKTVGFIILILYIIAMTIFTIMR